MRGRVVRLGPAIDTHPRPPRLSRRRSRASLGEAAALTVLLGIVAEVRGPLPAADQDRRRRRHARRRFRRARPRARLRRASTPTRLDGRSAAARETGELLGQGHLAMTIDQGADMQPLPGRRRARGPEPRGGRAPVFPPVRADPDAGAPRRRRAVRAPAAAHAWRAGGLMVQFLPASPERMRQADLPPGDAPGGPSGARARPPREDDAWVEAQLARRARSRTTS